MRLRSYRRPEPYAALPELPAAGDAKFEEVEKRTKVHWPTVAAWPAADTPAIWVGNRAALARFNALDALELQTLSARTDAEGYMIRVKSAGKASRVFVVGNDARGILFGVGRLLRELHMKSGHGIVDDTLSIATSPKYPLRGHQLGYQPKTHSYDAWDLPVWEQYYRDLALFGCNAVELVPPRSDDDADSPHFPRRPMEMMVGMSQLADAYGLDVWVWYLAMDQDYSDPNTVERALREWGEVFAKLPSATTLTSPTRASVSIQCLTGMWPSP